MTKKNFELIAREFNRSFTREQEIEREGNDTSSAQACLRVLIYNLTEELRGTNSNFDVVKFYLACGLTEQDFRKDYLPI